MYKKIPKFDGFRRKDVVGFVKMKLTIDKKWATKASAILIGRTLTDKQDGIGLSIWDQSFYSYHFDSFFDDSISYKLKQEFHKRLRKYAIQIINISDQVKLQKSLEQYYLKKKK